MSRAKVAVFAAAFFACSATVITLKAPAAATNAPAGVQFSNIVPMKRTAASLAQARSNELPEVTVLPRPHPLANLNRVALLNVVRRSPTELGSISLGKANRGSLFNAVRLPENPAWNIVNREHAWATEETVDALVRTFKTFESQYPGSRVYVGDLSKKTGGYLNRHRSHQSGRDVDIGYVYLENKRWYTRANAENLDRARTWALLKALISDADVEYIFIERPIQDLLREYLLSQAEDLAWLDTLFESPKHHDTLIRHAAGHSTHFHVRFHNNLACETGRRVQGQLANVVAMHPKQALSHAKSKARTRRN